MHDRPSMVSKTNRRRFLMQATTGTAVACGTWNWGVAKEVAEGEPDCAFFVIGDTHYLANKDAPGKIEVRSAEICGRLVDTLNNLAGSTIPENAGGGIVHSISGVVHAGDVIDTGDKNGSVQTEMQRTELACFREDYGLTGKDGRLKVPVYEIAGNHDAPQGTGQFIDSIKKRNKARPYVVNVSDNGVHYSWDWGKTHFVNLGLIVGADASVGRKRRYAALDSLAFLKSDLEHHVGDSGRPVVLTHHVDIARYTLDCEPDAPANSKEWDACDVHAFHDAIQKSNVVGIFYGHTHSRNIWQWDGRSTSSTSGIRVFNTDNASHFGADSQAFFYVESRGGKLVVREYATKDRWVTGTWSPNVWSA